MRSKLRSILALTILASMALCLFGCGDKKPPRSNAENKPKVAAVVGDHEISPEEMSYFYIDAISNYCSQYSAWLSYLLDTSKPLDQQVIDQATGKTWADNFVEMALNNAKNTYALYDAAVAAGHHLTDEEQTAINNGLASLDTISQQYGYENAATYLQSVYGDSASEKGYKEYYEITVMASSYYNAYCDQLKESYTDADLRAFETDKFDTYSSFSYAYYYMTVDDFLTGGTKGEDGTVTYSDAEKQAAEEAVKNAAQDLASPENNTVEQLDTAISALGLNGSCTEMEDHLYTNINTVMQEWLADDERENGDITALPYETISTESDREIRTLKGYYVVLFQGREDNNYNLVNVRHILIAFEGGTTNSSTGVTTYSNAEKTAAKEEAEKLYEEWKKGAATEDTFSEMAKEHSTDPGSKENGGLYEDVYPGQMVTNFNDWCFDDARKAGDHGMVETDYGYHIMYFVGESDTTYRDYMVTEELLTEKLTEWQTALNDAVTLEEKDTSDLNRSLIISISSE